MATIQLRTDDITGETLPDETPTTRITVNDPRVDISIEIDLSDDSAKKLVAALKRYTDKGREIAPPAPARLGADATESAAARAWAIAERPDLNVKERGAVPKAAIVAYRAHLANTDQEETPASE